MPRGLLVCCRLVSAWPVAAGWRLRAWNGRGRVRMTRPFAGSCRLIPWLPSWEAGWDGNPYAYAGNNPLNATDPTGLRPLTDDELRASSCPVGQTELCWDLWIRLPRASGNALGRR